MASASGDVHPVLALGDLRSAGAFPGTPLAVLGHPIGHSLSPAMHTAALADLARSEPRYADWRYHRFDIPPENLNEAMDLLWARGFRGVNLTVPHKVLALARLNPADVDPDARAAGAVNTLLRSEAGWRGFNTDGYGLAAGIREDLGRNLAGTPVLILGAGGAARGAAAECLRAGCASLWIANRTPATLEALIDGVTPGGAERTGRDIPIRGFPPTELPADLPPGLLVVNATSAGLRAGDAAPIDLARLPHPAGVYDMVYNPPSTALLRQAAALAIPCAGGLSMLVHQGARSLEIWSGVPAACTAPVMWEAARLALAGQSDFPSPSPSPS